MFYIQHKQGKIVAMSTIRVNPNNIFFVKNYTKIRVDGHQIGIKDVSTVGYLRDGEVYILPNIIELGYNGFEKQIFNPILQLEIIKNNPEINLVNWRKVTLSPKYLDKIPNDIFIKTNYYRYSELRKSFDLDLFNKLKLPELISIPYLMSYVKQLEVIPIADHVKLTSEEGISTLYVKSIGKFTIYPNIYYDVYVDEDRGQVMSTAKLCDLLEELNSEKDISKFILVHGKDPFGFGPISKHLTPDQLSIIESCLYANCL